MERNKRNAQNSNGREYTPAHDGEFVKESYESRKGSSNKASSNANNQSSSNSTNRTSSGASNQSSSNNASNYSPNANNCSNNSTNNQ